MKDDRKWPRLDARNSPLRSLARILLLLDDSSLMFDPGLHEGILCSDFGYSFPATRRISS